MGIEFRAIEPDEFDSLRKCLGLAFGAEPNPDDHRLRTCLPLHRTRCGFDDGQMISTSAAFELDMTIPGGIVACGGTTIVSVAPTHRRRGVMSRMMRAHLDDVREHEEPIAALWASDSAIYGRFGFGCAAICHDIEIDRRHVGFHRLAPDPGPVRVVEVSEAAQLIPTFYEGARLDVPGFFARTGDWWEQFRFADLEKDRRGRTAFRYVVVDGDAGITGFAQYRAKSEFLEGHGAGKVSVRDLMGSTPAAWAALWSYLLNHDLVAKIEADLRPPWDPIFDLLAGTRRVSTTRSDSLWVRIMDVPAALSARSYSAPLEVVLGLSDPLGDVTGTYRLGITDGRAECSKVTGEPDVSLDLEDLGACFMGRARFRELARAGRVEGDPVVLAALDAAFTWDPQPWCPEIF